MHFQTAHILLLVFSLAASLFVLIAATRYAMWSRPMVNGSSSWLGLCAYVGFVPLISLVYTITYLALLHFRKIPSFSPRALASRRYRNSSSSSPSPGGTSAKPPSASTLLSLLVITAAYTLAWLAQSTLCTACELAPIASGRQGVVPGWCPQSRFRESPPPPPSSSSSGPSSTVPTVNSADRAAMLASLALAKDLINWVIFVAGLCMVECCRRGWKMAQVLEAEAERVGVLRAYDPGVARGAGVGWDIKKMPMGAEAEVAPVAAYEFQNTAGRDGRQQQQGPNQYAPQPLLQPPNPSFAAGPTENRQQQRKVNSWFGIRAVQDVKVNLRVPGASYDTRV